MNKTRSPRTIILQLIRIFLLTASVLLLANLTVVQAQTNPAPACTKVKLPGPDLRAFLNTLTPGDVGCLRAGVHGARDTYAVWYPSGTPSAPITLKGYPGESTPTILGALYIDGDNLVLSGLLFDGPTGRVITPTTASPKGEVDQVSIYGDNVEVSHCEVRNNAYHAGIYLQDAFNARLIGNYIHDNGDRSDPNQANLDHGIYFASGSGLIANNLIERNYAFGVHLYPSASNVIVQQNTIVRNGRSGVIIGDEPSDPNNPPPTNNLIVNNIVAYNAQNSIVSWQLPCGGNNVVRNNLVWGNGNGNFGNTTECLTLLGNIQADPRFVGASDYHLQSGSPAIDAALSGYTQPDDYDFVPRPQGAASDIGAFEQQNTTPVGIEGDVAQRPNGDGLILSDDVVQIRRFSNGTHTPDQTTNEFQRADSAPFATRGDGKILSDDVVQARRYQNGTNPKQTAAGPMTQNFARTDDAVDTLVAKLSNTVVAGLSETVFENAFNGLQREMRVESTTTGAGQMVTVNISVDAQGDESEYGFTLTYDQTKLSNPVIGAGTAGASVRSCNTATAGQINCSVGGFSNNNPASNDSGIGEIMGADNLITVTFMAAANAPSGDTMLKLSNVNASNDAAQLVAISSTNGQVSILNRRRQVSQ